MLKWFRISPNKMITVFMWSGKIFNIMLYFLKLLRTEIKLFNRPVFDRVFPIIKREVFPATLYISWMENTSLTGRITTVIKTVKCQQVKKRDELLVYHRWSLESRDVTGHGSWLSLGSVSTLLCLVLALSRTLFTCNIVSCWACVQSEWIICSLASSTN